MTQYVYRKCRARAFFPERKNGVCCKLFTAIYEYEIGLLPLRVSEGIAPCFIVLKLSFFCKIMLAQLARAVQYEKKVKIKNLKVM
jgi:hypothetical protein